MVQEQVIIAQAKAKVEQLWGACSDVRDQGVEVRVL